MSMRKHPGNKARVPFRKKAGNLFQAMNISKIQQEYHVVNALPVHLIKIMG